MNNSLKSIGIFLAGIFVLAASVILGLLFILGAAWLTAKLYPVLLVLATLTTEVCILILLPLSLFRKTRSFSGLGFFLCSYFLGLTLWAWGLLITYNTWGILAVFLGLCFLGVGVVPLAILATLFHGMWSTSGNLILLLIVTVGIRSLGLFLINREQKYN